MRIITWNTNGLRATIKADLFMPLFSKYKPDVLALQETKSERDQIDSKYLSFGEYASEFESSKARKGYSGVATYYKTGLAKKVEIRGPLASDVEGRVLVLDFGEFYFINCYFPNGGGASERLVYKLDFYEKMLLYMKDLEKKKPVILTGDINVAHREIDIARPKENINHVGFLPEERAWMDEVLKTGFIDVFRHFHKDKIEYTWWDQKSRARDRNIGWRIDYFIVSPKLIKKIKSIKHLTDYMGSDHCPVVMDIDI